MSYFLKMEKSEEWALPVSCRLWEQVGSDDCSQHYHDAMEIIAMLDGEMECTADSGTYRLKNGDILLFNPYSVHSINNTRENAKYLCLFLGLSEIFNFHNSILSMHGEYLENAQSRFDEYFSADTEDGRFLFEYIQRLYGQMNNRTPAGEAAVLGEIYCILSVLFERHYQKNPENGNLNRSKQFMQKLSDYLKDNYYKSITTNDAAQALFMSSSRFSHLMQQYFGLNFSKYLRRYRIDCAIKNFSDSNCTIKEISEAVGFTDYCYFSHAFKEYIGTSPSVYFKKRKGK